MMIFFVRVFTVLQTTVNAIDLYKSVGFVSEDLTRKIKVKIGVLSSLNGFSGDFIRFWAYKSVVPWYSPAFKLILILARFRHAIK